MSDNKTMTTKTKIPVVSESQLEVIEEGENYSVLKSSMYCRICKSEVFKILPVLLYANFYKPHLSQYRQMLSKKLISDHKH